MIIDKDLEFSDKQAVTVTAYSNVIDTVVAGEAIPALNLNVLCVETFAVAGMKVELESSDTENFATPVVAISSKEFAVVDLKAGVYLLKTPLPTGLKRYIRLKYVVVSGPETAGKVSAFINND
ncbi:MAG: hypothetical protein PHE89_02675 [Alphaproteobacteria bacterium]|nr:hypothetical protein [Alphaproteobacteria bacterium]